MEKARLDRIKWLLEITERECNHELVLSAKNLLELGASPYIVHVISRLLPKELIKGEHFILAELLKSITGSSSLAGSDQEQEPQAKIAQGALVSFAQPDQSSSAV